MRALTGSEKENLKGIMDEYGFKTSELDFSTKTEYLMKIESWFKSDEETDWN